MHMHSSTAGDPRRTARQRVKPTCRNACWLLIAASTVAAAAPERWQSDPMATSFAITFLHAALVQIPALAGTVIGTAVLDDDAPMYE